MTKPDDTRRDQIMDTAQELFYSTGYEDTTVAVIIDRVGIAKGTFYHYFKSKENLLEAIAERAVGEVLTHMEPVLTRTDLTPVQKLNQYFAGATNWKTDNRELTLLMLNALYSEQNIRLRRRMVGASMEQVTPRIAKIIEEGVREGQLNVDKPEMTARFLMRAMTIESEHMATLVIENPDAPDLVDRLEDHFTFLEYTVERLLGAPEGSIRFANRELLQKLFGVEQEATK